MKEALLAVVLAFASSCGGKEIVPVADLPAPGSSECDTQGTTCVECNDAKWHCHGVAVSACPTRSTTGAGDTCFTCDSDGTGILPVQHPNDIAVVTIKVSCSQ